MRSRNPGEGRRAALELTAAAFPVFRHCVGYGWLSALTGGGAAALVLTAVRSRLGNRSLRDGCRSGLPGRIGTAILAASLLGLCLWAGADSTQAFPETAGSRAAACLMLALAWEAVNCGAEAPGRCGAVLLWLLAGLYGVVLTFSLPQIRPAWLAPRADWRGMLCCFGILLLPGVGLCLERDGRPAFPWQVWVTAALAAVGALTTSGILSPALAAEPEAFRTLSRSVSILGVMQRFEALISAAQLISGFCLCTLLLAAARSLLEALAGKARAVRIFRPVLPALLAMSWLNPSFLPKASGIAAICSGLFLILIQLLVPQKRKKKIR